MTNASVRIGISRRPGFRPRTRPLATSNSTSANREPSTWRASRKTSPWANVLQAYHVEILDGDTWRTVTAGQVIGHKQLRRFPAVTAQRVRLVIDKAAAPPAISEFGLHWFAGK